MPPESKSLARCDAALVLGQVRDIAVAAGVPPADAQLLADSLVAADVSGTSTHGVSRLNIYVRRIQAGLIDPKGKLTVVRKKGSVLALDAGNGLGQVQTQKALGKLVPLARANGVAAATVRNSQHFGAVSYYCNLMAEKGLILLAVTNCEPAMSPEGACQAFFGTNPIGASFPTGKGFPVKVDLATSVVARGNVVAANKQGKPIPLGWALDAEGRATTDAAEALKGTILTMAGHKGYALALLVEIFAGVLSGAAVGPEIGSMYKDMDRKQDVGHFLCLFDISAFMPAGEFTARLDRTIDAIKRSRRRSGVEEILVPGERSHRVAKDNLRRGIPIEATTFAEIEKLCAELKVPFRLGGRGAN
jgi:LDH2 family malate/lactate/ureidoglycolate dehydrogenase